MPTQTSTTEIAARAIVALSEADHADTAALLASGSLLLVSTQLPTGSTRLAEVNDLYERLVAARRELAKVVRDAKPVLEAVQAEADLLADQFNARWSR